MLSNLYSTKTVEDAHKTVEYIENRKKLLKEMAFEMKEDLYEKFTSFKFEKHSNPNVTQLIYDRLGSTELGLVTTRCSITDHFSEFIGQYICVKKALHQGFDKAMKAIELKKGFPEYVLCKPHQLDKFKIMLGDSIGNGISKDRKDVNRLLKSLSLQLEAILNKKDYETATQVMCDIDCINRKAWGISKSRYSHIEYRRGVDRQTGKVVDKYV